MSDALLSLFLAETEPTNPLEFVRENIDLNLGKQISKLKIEIARKKEELTKLYAIIAEMRKLGNPLIEEEEEVENEENIEMVEGDAESQLIDSEIIENGSINIEKDPESINEEPPSEAIDEQAAESDAKTNDKDPNEIEVEIEIEKANEIAA